MGMLLKDGTPYHTLDFAVHNPSPRPSKACSFVHHKRKSLLLDSYLYIVDPLAPIEEFFLKLQYL